MFRALAVCAALAATLLAPTAPASATDAPAAPRAASPAARTSPPSRLQRLHATHGRNAAIVNEKGAQVLLRAVNVNQLGEYYQANPDLAPTIPLTRRDFRDIAAAGFNSVRLLVSWSRLEPTPGAYDTAYVAEVRRAVRWAAGRGLHVVLDMHQDAYGIAVDTPPGETCPSGTHPANGWDGAPAWATITDGASTCVASQRETAPAVMHAWQNFWDDTDGVQTHLVRTWGRLARDFARSRAVAGFDLLNEPGFGLELTTSSTTDLGRFYHRAIRAVRRGERAGGGFSHPVFFEPSVMWSAFGSWDTPAPGFTRDRNIVFAPHVYAESLSPNSIASGFASAASRAEKYGAPLWSGEWGFFPDQPADAADQVRRYGAAEDAYAVGGAWWSWKQACGDPHVVSQPGGQPAPVSPSLVRYSCPDQVASPIDPAFGDVLSRPTARAVPGRIDLLATGGRHGLLDLRGTHRDGAARCGLRVFVPGRLADEKVTTDGVRRLERRHRLGNVVLRGCVSDEFRLRIG